MRFSETGVPVVGAVTRILLSIICWWWLPASLCASPAGPATDYFEPRLLAGSIYEKEGGRLLFTFRRTAMRAGDTIRVLREFRNPDGSLAAQERVVYERGRLVRFELDELQIGANGRAVVEAAPGEQRRIDFEYAGSARQDGKPKRKVETIGDEPLTADSIGVFLANHWDEINSGAVVRFRYLVVPRLETIGFKFSRESTGEFRGKKVVRIKMEPTSWMIAQMVDPLMFTVESDPPHRVLQYWGRTTPKVRSGQGWRDLDALSVFHWE